MSLSDIELQEDGTVTWKVSKVVGNAIVAKELPRGSSSPWSEATKFTQLTSSTTSYIPSIKGVKVQISQVQFERGALVIDVPEPAPSAPFHIENWAYDDWAETTVPATFAQKWLTYAQNGGDWGAPVLADADNINTFSVMYWDTNRIWSSNPMFEDLVTNGEAAEDWWMHEPGYTDSAHRLSFTSTSWGAEQTAYQLNHSVPAVQAWLAAWCKANYDDYHILFMDDMAACISDLVYDNVANVTSTEEITTNEELQASHIALSAAITHVDGSPFLQVYNGQQPNPYIARSWALMTGSVIGFCSEGNPWYNGFSSWFSCLLDDMAYLANNYIRGFIALLSYGSNTPQARRVALATQFLGYEPGSIVSWPKLETGALAVWPEQGLYPAKPLQEMGDPGSGYDNGQTGTTPSKGGHNDLLVAAGSAPPSGCTDPHPGVYRTGICRCLQPGCSNWTTGCDCQRDRRAGDGRRVMAPADIRALGYVQRGRCLLGWHD